ncbi:hypothetical protein SAMN05444745_11182 [Arthrobacter sp. OV608]|nr:hypothetical protein SAMN05444745_11182 [Arthrobacter sp. OV608]
MFMLVATAWFVLRRRIAEYQVYLVTERFKVLPARDKAEQVRGMQTIGTLFCALLFSAGAVIATLRMLLQ